MQVFDAGDLYQFHLVELMLADQAADVLSIRSGFAAKAWRVGGVVQRELAAVKNLCAMEIGQRHFGGRNQKEIPFTGNLEEIRFELRQLTGALQRRGVGEERRFDLAVAMLASVEVEHEVDQR